MAQYKIEVRFDTRYENMANGLIFPWSAQVIAIDGVKYTKKDLLIRGRTEAEVVNKIQNVCMLHEEKIKGTDNYTFEIII